MDEIPLSGNKPGNVGSYGNKMGVLGNSSGPL